MKEEIFIKYLWYGYEGIGYVDMEILFKTIDDAKNAMKKIRTNNSNIYHYIDEKNGVVEKIYFDIYLRQINEIIIDY